MAEAPRFSLRSLELFERPVILRMPFRFGVVTLREAPQAFVRAEIALPDGRSAVGGAAELMAPKWFDKNLALSNEENFEQLRGLDVFSIVEQECVCRVSVTARLSHQVINDSVQYSAAPKGSNDDGRSACIGDLACELWLHA